MKTVRFTLIGAFASVLLFTACQRTIQKDLVQPEPATQTQTKPVEELSGKGAPSGPCNPNAYTITLESRTLVAGNWEWVWSVQNPNPGNGSNGTSQNLSHWGMQFGGCFAWSSVVSAAYSANGSDWTAFTPLFQTDPSQGCMTTPVLKFDYGTTGSNKSYYKLVVNQYYDVQPVPGYYKSGANTGCCTFTFSGIGCSVVEEPK